jgi:hypothetical protein
MKPRLLDAVRLKAPLAECALPAGELGAIVLVLGVPGEAYEVEFCDERGATIAMATLKADQFEIVARAPGSTASWTRGTMSKIDELQMPWQLDGLRMPGAGELVVNVCAGGSAGYPDPVGRHGNAVRAEPEVFIEAQAGEFHFTQCVVVRVWDDIAMLDSEGEFEGDTFRTYSSSPLLASLEHQRAVSALFHYRLMLDNGGTVIDVVARKAPRVGLRTFGHPPMAA